MLLCKTVIFFVLEFFYARLIFLQSYYGLIIYKNKFLSLQCICVETIAVLKFYLNLVLPMTISVYVLPITIPHENVRRYTYVCMYVCVVYIYHILILLECCTKDVCIYIYLDFIKQNITHSPLLFLFHMKADFLSSNVYSQV